MAPRTPPPFDQFQPFSFAKIPFPYETYSVTGGIRKHKHEYPHSDGGAVEKLGRELYEIHVSVNFTAGLVKQPYEELLNSLAALRSTFEEQTTDALVIPHIGSIRACADKWTETARNTNRSTIKADLTFYEDLNSALQLLDTVTISSASLPDLANKFRILAEPLSPQPTRTSFTLAPQGPNTLNIFEAIDALSVSISGIKDQQELYGSLVASKIDGIIALFQQADRSEPSLNDPQNYLVLDAMHALWQAMLNLRSDLQNTGFRAQLYGTPCVMSISQVSFAIYGNTLATSQLLQLNDLSDPLAIPAGTTIVFYPALQALAA